MIKMQSESQLINFNQTVQLLPLASSNGSKFVIKRKNQTDTLKTGNTMGEQVAETISEFSVGNDATKHIELKQNSYNSQPVV